MTYRLNSIHYIIFKYIYTIFTYMILCILLFSIQLIYNIITIYVQETYNSILYIYHTTYTYKLYKPYLVLYVIVYK